MREIPTIESYSESSEVLDLIQRSQAGNFLAYENLIRGFHDPLYQLVYSITSHREDSEILVQETFIRAWKFLGNIPESLNFYKWICRMAIHQTLHFCNQPKNKKKALFTEFDPEIKTTDFYRQLSGKGSILRKMSLSELQEKINNALLQLSPKNRAVMVTHRVQGASYADLAELFNCSEGTIHFRLFFSYKRLKIHLIELIRWDDQESEETIEQHLFDLLALKTYERPGAVQVEKTIQNTMRIVRSTNNIPSLLLLPEKNSAWLTQPRYGVIALFVLFLGMHQIKRPLPAIADKSTVSKKADVELNALIGTNLLYPTGIPGTPPFPRTNESPVPPFFLK